MIRFVLKRERRDTDTGYRAETMFTIDCDLDELESALRIGGHGPSGYDIVSLVGVEIKDETP